MVMTLFVVEAGAMREQYTESMIVVMFTAQHRKQRMNRERENEREMRDF
jgi:hypothetical protein